MSEILRSVLLDQLGGTLYGFTTRALGASYEEIAKQMGVSSESLMTLKQIHSNQVVAISHKGPEIFLWRDQKEGDALVTNQPGILVGVKTADCVPLLIYDPIQKVVAAVHAGWRGLVAGILESSLNQMRLFGSAYEDLVVIMGPALCGFCFEVGPQVVKTFKHRFGLDFTVRPGKGDRSSIDLREACRLILEEQHLSGNRIEFLPYCTACQPERFFSYRKGDQTGRQLSFIGL